MSDHLDHELIKQVQSPLTGGPSARLEMSLTNAHRAVGSMVSGEIARKFGSTGLPDDSICVKFRGSAGQSFGAFLSQGITFEFEGDANDYVGKGLSGGHLVVKPSKEARFAPEENVIVGNTVLYGAIAGEAFFAGLAGERFAVRNSGAHTVVEGVGDHGREYMTGGTVVVLGPAGRNFAAGMSGGIAYVFDRTKTFRPNCNLDMVELKSLGDEPEIWTVSQAVLKLVAFSTTGNTT